MIQTKTIDVPIKAPQDAPEGTFTGYASVFGNVDSYGDVVVKGAFVDSLAEYGETGAGVPCYWGHQMSDPNLNVGVTTEAHEDDHGLFVKVQLDMETPNGAQVHRLIQTGRVRQMSFAFDVVDAGWGERDGETVYELRKLKLHEVSVVPIGANPQAELIAAKARQKAAHETSGAPVPVEPAEVQEQAKTGGHPSVVLAQTILTSLNG